MSGVTTVPPGVVALAVALIALLIFLRGPARLLHPQFYAEDGYVFFKSAWEQGFFASLFEPYSGYLHLVPRLVAGVALLGPLVLAPLVFTLSAFLIMLVPVWYLLGNRMRCLPAFSTRIVCAALFAAMPAVQETYVNITNAHWYLLFATCFVLASEQPVNKRQLVADTLVLGLYALSSPLSAIFLPLAVARAWRDRRRADLALPWLLPTALGLGIALQALTSLAHPRVTQGLGVAYGTLPLIREFVMFGFYNVILGMWGNYKHFAGFGSALYLLGLAALILLALATFSRRSRLGLLLLYAATAVFAIEHVFPVHPGSSRDTPDTNLRYYSVLVFFTLFAALQTTLSRGHLRYIGGAILAAAVLVGIPGDYVLVGYPDTHFADQVAVFRTRSAGTSYSFPIIPVNAVPMVLCLKEGQQARPPLEGKTCLPEPAQASVNISFIGRSPTAATYVTARGTAYDHRALKPPGGVFVAVDGRLFPAITTDVGKTPGFERMLSLPEYRRSAFWRDIPVAEIGRGRHTLSLIVMTHDRRSYYQPTGTGFVTVP